MNTPPVTPYGSNVSRYFQLSERWRLFAEVHKAQARQMISNSNTLRMVGLGHLTQLYTCMVPIKQHKRKRYKRLLHRN